MIEYKFNIGDFIGDVHKDEYILVIPVNDNKVSRYMIDKDSLNGVWRYLKYGYRDILEKYGWLEDVDYDFKTFGGKIVYYDKDGLCHKVEIEENLIEDQIYYLYIDNDR